MPRSWSNSLLAASADDYEYCRKLIRTGSRTFHAASLLLPAKLRDPAYALYAFCRVSDDAVDAPDAHRNAIAVLTDRLDRAYAGRPLPLPCDRAFADTVSRFSIPRALPEALLEGMEWDLEGRQCPSLSDLQAYSARVAGTVGAMMTVLMGVREPAVLARACDLGVAMQFTNIARDVGEDARNGRLYLPHDWLREAGIDPAIWLADPRFTPELAGVVRRLLDEADQLYRRAITGISGLPASCRPAIRAACDLYAEIGREVERAKFDSISRRAVVPPVRKVRVVGRSLGGTLLGRTLDYAPPLDETRFLVEASLRQWAPARSSPLVPWWHFGERWTWVIDLLIALESRHQRL
ncbi:phytoene/squalene synthase family protein [Rhodospirillum rubrum]|uniref:phytoene/squalene synthase family protein n=1 Tax=Rhodospirillum rubrum TaxID=1085 RepID=UPI000037AC8F|nr:phytoene/squalene synthase family protein [Rhodospirillum rubrum]